MNLLQRLFGKKKELIKNNLTSKVSYYEANLGIKRKDRDDENLFTAPLMLYNDTPSSCDSNSYSVGFDGGYGGGDFSGSGSGGSWSSDSSTDSYSSYDSGSSSYDSSASSYSSSSSD